MPSVKFTEGINWILAPLEAVLGVGSGRDVWGVDAMLTTALRRNKVEYPEACLLYTSRCV